MAVVSIRLEEKLDRKLRRLDTMTRTNDKSSLTESDPIFPLRMALTGLRPKGRVSTG